MSELMSYRDYMKEQREDTRPMVYCEECKYWSEREHQKRLMNTICRGDCQFRASKTCPCRTAADQGCRDGVVFVETEKDAERGVGLIKGMRFMLDDGTIITYGDDDLA